MTSSTKIQWRVQVRKSRAHKWVNKGLFETRDRARIERTELRDGWSFSRLPYGFGNTRIVRYVKGG